MKVTSLLTVEQCAEILQCSEDLVIRLIRNGELPRVSLTARETGARVGRKNYRVRPEAIEAFIKSRERVSMSPVSPKNADRTPVLPSATGPDGVSRLRRPKAR